MASGSTPEDFKPPRGSLQHRCGLCSTTSSKPLALCTGCRAVRYCSRDHQVEHRAKHKGVCHKIKKARAKVEKEDSKIRNATPDFMTPANAFETHVGHFWGMFDTRDYMRARFALADMLRKTGTLDGVGEALDHVRDMLRLNRSDNMGIRDLAPALMIQLDQDQQCYDFVKWWATTGQRGDYDWGDMSLGYLDIEGADTFEDFAKRQASGDVNHIAALLLLKLKVVVDILNMRLVRKVLASKAIPPELWSAVERCVVRSPLSVELTRRESRELVETQRKLETQVKQLAGSLREANDQVVFGLLNPDEWLSVLPESYSPGDPREMQLLLHHSYAAWWQTEGVLELLRNAQALAAKDSEDEMDDMMTGSTFRTAQGSRRTKAELLVDVSTNRIWGYIDWAIEDAASLAAERPSAHHMAETRRFNAEMMAEDDDVDGESWSSDDVGEEEDAIFC